MRRNLCSFSKKNGVNHDLDEAKKRSKKRHKKGGFHRKTKPHNRAFATVCRDRTEEGSLVYGEKGSKSRTRG